MFLSLRMIQKPPVVFYPATPMAVLSRGDVEGFLSRGLGRERVFSLVWALYCRTLLSQVDPCMEAADGVKETVRRLFQWREAGELTVTWKDDTCCTLRYQDVVLYLLEKEDHGALLLYFLPPEKFFNQRDECRVDLSDYGPDAAVQLIATAFACYKSIYHFFFSIACELHNVR